MQHNFINIDKWNLLTPAYQSLIRTASALANERTLAKYDTSNAPALMRLLRGGAFLTVRAGAGRPHRQFEMTATLGILDSNRRVQRKGNTLEFPESLQR